MNDEHTYLPYLLSCKLVVETASFVENGSRYLDVIVRSPTAWVERYTEPGDTVKLRFPFHSCGPIMADTHVTLHSDHASDKGRTASEYFTAVRYVRQGENPMAGKVSGYRQLDDNELELVNALKAQGQVVQDLLDNIELLIKARTEKYGAPDGEHYRAMALGKTNIQQGYMWLIRAVAAPNGLI